MSDDIKPALTPEQWQRFPKVYFREPRQYKGAALDEGYGVELGDDGAMFVWDNTWALTVDKPDRHAVAAICLHQQPFGFTQADVDALRQWVNDYSATIAGTEHLASIASRIAALLPPK